MNEIEPHKTLLEKAKGFKRRQRNREITQEDKELAIALLKKDISAAQASNAIYNNPKKVTSVYTFLWKVLMVLLKEKKLKIVSDSFIVLENNKQIPKEKCQRCERVLKPDEKDVCNDCFEEI